MSASVLVAGIAFAAQPYPQSIMLLAAHATRFHPSQSCYSQPCAAHEGGEGHELCELHGQFPCSAEPAVQTTPFYDRK